MLRCVDLFQRLIIRFIDGRSQKQLIFYKIFATKDSKLSINQIGPPFCRQNVCQDKRSQECNFAVVGLFIQYFCWHNQYLNAMYVSERIQIPLRLKQRGRVYLLILLFLLSFSTLSSCCFCSVVGCCVVKPDKKIKLKCCRVYEFLFLTFLTFRLVLDLFVILGPYRRGMGGGEIILNLQI